MKWREMRKSDNVEDIRRSAGRRVGPAAAGGVGIGAVLLALVIGLLTGQDPGAIIGGMQGAPAQQQQQQLPQGEVVNDEDSEFVRAILGDTEETWSKVFRERLGGEYPAPKLVLFSGGVQSACGAADTQAGPFYCPLDEKIYLDMGFFKQLRSTSGRNADFARAYAISHEVGHHIQHKLGLLTKVRERQQQVDKTSANALQVRVELQADCLAGVWGHYTIKNRNLITREDLAAAMNTAAEIGDDYMQKQARGYVVPESFTHGSSEERQQWFAAGLKTGDIGSCDTFQ
jgi:hypothetical protein